VNLPIRVRLTAAYVLTAAVLTTIGVVVFGASVHIGVDHRLDEQLRSKAVRLATQVTRNGPDSVHAMTPFASDMLVALVDPNGRVAKYSPALAGAALLDADQLAATQQNDGGFWSVGAGPDYRLYAVPAPAPGGTWVVVVATPLALQNELSASVTTALVAAAIAVVVLGGIGAWFLAGVALRPVERLRREVASISETDPGVPVRVPATGDEIAALAKTMNNLLTRIAAGLAHQRRFVADASHEIRTPLANLRTALELAGRPGRSVDDLREAVHHAEHEAIRLGHLVDDLLVLAAADDRIPLDLLPDEPIEPLLTAALTAARPAADLKEVTLRSIVDDDLTAAMHPGQVRQVLDNLLSNAVRHAPPGSAVVLSAIVVADTLLITATDEGTGFPPGFAEQAFERFRRADHGRSNGGGSGLGLAVVRAVARAHGGDATATNRATGGAVVRVRIPRTPTTSPPRPRQSDITKWPPPASPTPAGSSRQHR
jgi:signal transduction histidine kinase